MALVGHSNHVLDGSQDPHGRGKFWEACGPVKSIGTLCYDVLRKRDHLIPNDERHAMRPFVENFDHFRPRLEGARLEILEKLLTPTVPSSTYHNAHIHRTHTYQFPSSFWAGALDRYKGLSAGVQSRLDLCPQRTNERPPFHTRFLNLPKSAPTIDSAVFEWLTKVPTDRRRQTHRPRYSVCSNSPASSAPSECNAA